MFYQPKVLSRLNIFNRIATCFEFYRPIHVSQYNSLDKMKRTNKSFHSIQFHFESKAELPHAVTACVYCIALFKVTFSMELHKKLSDFLTGYQQTCFQKCWDT